MDGTFILLSVSLSLYSLFHGLQIWERNSMRKDFPMPITMTGRGPVTINPSEIIVDVRAVKANINKIVNEIELHHDVDKSLLKELRVEIEKL